MKSGRQAMPVRVGIKNKPVPFSAGSMLGIPVITSGTFH
jgi:hypothetical protein